VLGDFDTTLAAARAGAEWAWREVYRETAGPVERFLRARGVPDPDDVLGDTFLNVVRSIDRFDGDEIAFRAWIFAIARNTAIDRARWLRRRPSIPSTHDDLSGIGPVGDSEADAMEGIAVDHVRRVLDRLTPDQRDVLLLRIVGGLTVEQVASVVGRKPGAVKMLQARGVAAIRRDIERGAVTL
jgi:RNA polymerase sigma-70 factor, ECF subfamily